MKLRLLLCVVLSLVICSVQAQKKVKKNIAYAITGVEKGSHSWTEVRLIDISTGEVVQTIYESANETQPLNARTGKPIVKKEADFQNPAIRRVVRLDDEISSDVRVVKAIKATAKVKSEKPFATNSAACALDRKNNRLYYTPMGINQLRYIDLKSNTFYYFEDEPFGALSNSRDVPNQITRMVIASDGNGYALTNNGEHLIRFTTGKKPVITDLGGLTDDPANGNNSVRSRNGYGGDIIADNDENLYLFTANRKVFKINIASRRASYLGTIQGLPREFSTNGAVAEEGMNVVVGSANSTLGFYRVDLKTMKAEKASGENKVFNSSDLANSVLLSDKKKKNKQEQKPVEQQPLDIVKEEPTRNSSPAEDNLLTRVSVYPNPVTAGFVKVEFQNQEFGNYTAELVDISGKLVSSKSFTIMNSLQIEEFRFPASLAKGNYVLKIHGQNNKVVNVSQLAIQ